jgi:regulator of protease activity HflC (stomatin/prohibitin superfamily)
MHWRFPIIDRVYRQSIRLRLLTIPLQTLTTADGKTLTIGAALGYSVADVRRLYETLHNAEDTLGNIVQSAIAEFVATNGSTLCTPDRISDGVMARMDGAQWGLADFRVRITDFALVRTFRLIQDGKWYTGSKDLDTTYAEGEMRPA